MSNLDIFDSDLLGKKDLSGNVATLTGKDALKNSIIGWLSSFRGDIIRSPNRAGYVTKHLYKPMNDYNRQNLIDAIVDGVHQDYYPSVKLQDIEVIPNYEAKTWEIKISVYSYLIKDSTEVNVVLRNFV